MAQCSGVARSTGARCRRQAVEGDRCRAHREDDRSDTSRTLSAVAESGDRMATLRRLRQVLADTIDAGPPARDLAALSRRLQMVMAELEEMGGPASDDEGGSQSADEISRRRAEKLAAAADS